MSTNDLYRYEIPIKIEFFYIDRFQLVKYLTLVMYCLNLRLVAGPLRLTDHDLDHVLVICGLHLVHGAKPK